ncbi:MAG TPA: metallophosphoesterase [Bacteroidales bacterium]|nr:metallophosphoesterase [Bacteroidales bacterium]
MGIFIILILTDLFVWWRLLTDMKKNSRVALALAIAVKSIMTALLLWLITGMIFYRGDFADPANAFGNIAFGTVAALTITIGISYSAISISIRILSRMLHRRLTLLTWANIIFAGVIIILFADGYFRQRFDVRTITQEIIVDNLDHRLERMKIVLISDLHLSSYYGHYDRLEDVIESVNDLEPDILFNTGDFITYGWQEFGGCDTILRRARSTIGAFAIPGNHDDGTYYTDFDEAYGEECTEMINRKVAASGYTMLNDSFLTVSYKGAGILIAGVITHGHHLDMRYGDFEKAMSSPDTSALKILLVHDPAAWDTVRFLPTEYDLTLSGHTHGMQVGLPTPWGTITPASYFHKYWGGHYEFKGMDLFVTTGLGTMGLAERIFMPPEIVLLTLKSK